MVEDKTKVVIVEDHKLFREGLKSLLADKNDLEVVGEARRRPGGGSDRQALPAGHSTAGSFHAQNERHFRHERNQESISGN